MRKSELADMGSGASLTSPDSRVTTPGPEPKIAERIGFRHDLSAGGQPGNKPCLPLPANYDLKTEIIKNQTELLAMIIKGMRQ